MKKANSTLFVVAVITLFVLATGYGTAAAQQSEVEDEGGRNPERDRVRQRIQFGAHLAGRIE